MNIRSSSTAIPSWLWLGLLLLLSAAIKLIDITKVSLWIDEAYSFLVANGHPYPITLNRLPMTVGQMYQSYIAWQPLDWDQLISILKQNVHMPLYYLLLNPWLKWFGNNEFGLRSFSTFWSTLTLIPFYLLSLQMAKQYSGAENSKRIAQWSTFFMALVPMQLFYAQEGRMYALSMFWAVSAALMFWLSVESCKRNEPTGKTLPLVLGYTLTLLFGLFSHYMFIFYLSFHIAYLAFSAIKKPGKAFWLFLVPVTLCTILLIAWLPIYKIQQAGVWDNYHFAKSMMKPMRYINKFFLLPMESFANNNIFARLYYFPLAAAILLGHFVLRTKKTGTTAEENMQTVRLPIEGFILTWMFVPLFLQCGYDIIKHTHTSIITRYLLLLTPAMPLLAGFCIQEFKQAFSKKYVALAYSLATMTILFAFASVLHTSPAYMHSNKKEINGAANYLSSHLQSGDLIFTNGPLGAPNLVVFYLNQHHPQQPFIYWMKDYAGKITPLPDIKALSRYKRIWFFANRSNEQRGLDIAKQFVRQYFPNATAGIDPAHQLDLYTR